MRLRTLARSKRIVPARSPSTSMTKTPNASGSASERSISASTRVVILRADRGEERLDVLVRDELDEEVDVVGAAHGGSRRSRGRPPVRRTPKKRSPDASATPARMSARPASIAVVTGSSSSSAP